MSYEEVERPAGFWIRFGASLLDGIIILAILGTISLILFGDFDYTKSVSLSLVEFLYMLLLPVFWYGYVLGKKICGIRIIKMDGSNVGIVAMLLRLVVAGIIYALTLGIALIVSAFMVGLREDKRAIHDFIAGTYVTHMPPEA
ncbi:RDD family protein [Pontibacillus sp. HMF3514]|uniref:RDD family protein n=1 Tax=Pontibacillus sp. HMF3514 TaxID=2692425 RepID=UPI00131F9181|nr:RDD family protein [Pontibacillus sp. HMF3514]QHE51865.1 RDD family protein [Pontibacillus sp. HMF3514]